MSTSSQGDRLHRLVKLAMDRGAASSLAEAEAMFRGYRLNFVIDPAAAADAVHQKALLTGVALARRVFLGGVTVAGALDAALMVPYALGATVGDAVVALGGSLSAGSVGGPLIAIGDGERPRTDGFHIRTVFAGWRGGIVPAHSNVTPRGGPAMPLAAMLAVALGVNEAFMFVSGEAGCAGHRRVGLSLWDPSPSVDWLVESGAEPELRYLPSRLWLIGLGHLGQAYLWGLGLLPYADPTGVSLVLQDVDVITPSTESTSILSGASVMNQKKTRAMAAWAECRGFDTAIHERLFDGSFRRQDHEPGIALCGLDNALGRRELDKVGFDYVVEAGLGRGHRDFRTIRIHTLPGGRQAQEIWRARGSEEDVTEKEAYKAMLRNGELDRCGVTLLAGKAVGAPFVGAVASCLVLAEVLRLLHGGPLQQVIAVDLMDIAYRSVCPRTSSWTGSNPGYVRAA